MKHGSLFSGIGGFDLAAEWMGWENVFNCEINPFCQKVLKYHFPNSKGYADIKSTNFSIHRRKIDILTGGFPCQPFSLAGNRKGTDDDRHLWPEMLRAITEIQPSWVVGENVYGFVNWDGGVVFEQMQIDLENTGYEVTAVILPACAVNAPHRRERCWIIAHRNGIDSNLSIQQRGQNTSENINIAGKNERGVTTNPGLFRQAKPKKPTTGIEQCDKRNVAHSEETKRQKPVNSRSGRNGLADIRCNVADTNGIGHERKEHGQTESGQFTETISGINWLDFPTQSPIRLRDDGISDKLLIFVAKELYDKISNTSQENRIENLQEVWKRISTTEIWEQIRGFYSLESKIILFKTMQLYSTANIRQIELSPFSEELSKPILQHLSRHGEFRRSPQGRKLEKQRTKQFGNSLSFLPHEVALAARRFEAAIAKFENWHRNESLKAFGNSIVPQIALQIFKAIEKYEQQRHT